MTDVQSPEEVPVARLPAYYRAETSLYHWSGRLLAPAGQYLTPDLISALREAGIETVYTAPARRVRPEYLESMNVWALESEEPLRFAIYDRGGNLLASRKDVLSPAHLDALHRRKDSKVYYFRSSAGGQAADFEAIYTRKCRDRLDDEIVFGEDRLRPERAGIPLGRTTRVFSGRTRPKAVLSTFEDFYRRGVSELDRIWRVLKDGGYVRNQDLAPLVNETVDRFLNEREVLTALATVPTAADAYGEHCFATAVYALLVALKFGYNRAQARDLVVAAFFHDVGSIMIPPEILAARRNLSKGERETIFSHIEHALFLMERIDWTGEDFKIAVYQHHERGTGAGYPTGYKAEKIHEFAAVLAAADVYHALISDRPHRAAHMPSQGLGLLMKMGAIGLIDRRSVKALAAALSLYPIGTGVVLSTGEVGRTVAASAYPDRPWVSVTTGPDGELLKTPRMVDLSKYPHTSIRAEVVPQGEALTGF